MSRGRRLVVIGAGPAGMAAAAQAARFGLDVRLLDQEAQAGGQIYRQVENASAQQVKVLGADYLRGKRLIEEFRASGAELVSGTRVWNVEGNQIFALRDGRSEVFHSDQIILATGAMERPTPIPGWTLPGVMNAGAAQILLKTAGLVPQGRVAMIGCGPLLLLVAQQLLAAGVEIAGLLHTGRRGAHACALPHLPRALRATAELVQGASWLASLRVAGVPRWRVEAPPRIEARGEQRSIGFLARGKSQEILADTVLLHHGVIPNTQLTRLLRLEHAWHAEQCSWRPIAKDWGETSRPEIRIAGDGGGIIGALASAASGRLAAIGAALYAGKISDAEAEGAARPLERELARQLALRPLLDALYAPPEWLLTPADEVTVCRCENVSSGEIRAMAQLGCLGPNQTKFFSRCGMGRCQGRMCGDSVSHLLADAHGLSVETVGYYRLRPPLFPLPLDELARRAEALIPPSRNQTGALPCAKMQPNDGQGDTPPC